MDLSNYKEVQAKRFFGKDTVVVQGRLKRAYKFFSPFVKKNKPVLDIGTRDGWFVEYLEEEGFCNVLGTDLTEDAVKHAQRHGRNVIVGDAHDLSGFEDKKYETVLMIHSLEHCYDPQKVVDGVYRILAPEGIFFIEVPLENVAVKTMAHFCNFTNVEDVANLLGEARFQLLKKEIYFPRADRPKIRHLMCVFKKVTARIKSKSREVFKERFTSKRASVGALMELVSFNSVLYIGASARLKRPGIRLKKLYFAEQLAECCDYVDLLEIWPENIEGLKDTPPFRKLILGDARTIDEHVDQKYDLIFWWHGPEHIYEYEIPRTVEKMKRVCNKHIIFGCPWGIYEQGITYGNPHEEHKSHLQPEFYENLGFLTAVSNQSNHKNGNITAWMDIGWKDEDPSNITGNRK